MKPNNKKIIFTGGGTSGHVTPNLALIKALDIKKWEVVYIGSKRGIEKNIVEREKIPYIAIATGKLRRYFSWQNFIDPFKILFGIIQAFFIVRKMKPKIIFSKGGFVAVPVVIAGWLNQIPVYVHESDYTPGLANKLSFLFASKIFLTFEDTAKYVKQKNKIDITGAPVRSDFFTGDAKKGRKYCGFNTDRKIILVFGGGLGSQVINNSIRKILPELLQAFQVAHICGPNKSDKIYENLAGYQQFEYLHEALFDVMAAADIVISRSGANSLYELIVLKKPHILIPLSKKASRGDQILNAKYFEQKGLSMVIHEEELTPAQLLTKINDLNQNWQTQKDKLEAYDCINGTTKIISKIT